LSLDFRRTLQRYVRLNMSSQIRLSVVAPFTQTQTLEFFGNIFALSDSLGTLALGSLY